MIDKIELVNFKCFERNTLPLNNITILAGPNGVGKSTVIQALLLVRQAHDSYMHNFGRVLKGIVSQEAKAEDDDKNKIALNAKILLNGPFLLSLSNSKEILNSDSNLITIKLFSGKETIEYVFDASKSDVTLFLKDYPLSPATKLFPTNLYYFYYLNAERLGPRNIQTMNEQEYLSTGSQGEFTGHVIATLEQKNTKLEKDDPRCIVSSDNQKYLTVKKQIEAWMDFILPGIEINVEAFKKLNLSRVSLRNKVTDTDFLHPYNMGFGITYVLPIVVSGLIARKNTMLIIENPEAHLHPRGQSKIGQFIAHVAASGVQVILETHSEHVINGIRIAALKKIIDHSKCTINFFSVSEKQGKYSVDTINISEKGELSSWPKDFFDQEENDLAEIFKLTNS